MIYAIVDANLFTVVLDGPYGAAPYGIRLPFLNV
jgi:hypothetical protein